MSLPPAWEAKLHPMTKALLMSQQTAMHQNLRKRRKSIDDAAAAAPHQLWDDDGRFQDNARGLTAQRHARYNNERF